MQIYKNINLPHQSAELGTEHLCQYVRRPQIQKLLAEKNRHLPFYSFLLVNEKPTKRRLPQTFHLIRLKIIKHKSP